MNESDFLADASSSSSRGSERPAEISASLPSAGLAGLLHTPSDAVAPPDIASGLEVILDAFDAAWHQKMRPRLEDFLPSNSDPNFLPALVGLVRIDLERRIGSGERVRVECYVTRFSELRREDVLLQLVLREQNLRRRYDPAFDAEEYPSRFPQLASQIGPTMQTVIPEDLRQGVATAAAGGDADLDLREYVLLELVGRGGMGEVYRGRDPALARHLAVKVLRAELRGHREAERRFEQEARINGILQHPSIVPVHNLGRLPDGRLYFTMKLVRGQTLADILVAKDRAGRLPELLGIFEKVCQALAYAHSRGVIHRDLKPGNVMVGAFGEVQVMDWGLAKVLQRPAPAPAGESTLGVVFRTNPPGSTAEKDAPTGVVGTPSYMAPEQTRGGDGVDERADVFGLGGILCTLLTGKPPYTGASKSDVQGKAAAGDLGEAFSRLDGCGADAELVALCRDCLVLDLDRRPRHAGEVTERVAAYQAAVQERLRKAELGRAAAHVKVQEERKRRKFAVGLLVAILCLVVVGGGTGVWFLQQRAELRRGVNAELEKLPNLLRQWRWKEVETILDSADNRMGAAAPDDLRVRVVRARADLDLAMRLDAIRQRPLVEGKFANRRAESDYVSVFQDAGLWKDGDDETAVAARVQTSGVSGFLIAALDDWASLAEDPNKKSWLMGVARRAAPDPWGDRLRDPTVWQDRQALQRLADDALQDDGAKISELSPQALDLLGSLMKGAGADEVPLLRAAQRHYPNDFWLNLALGLALYDAKQVQEAVGYYRAAVALRPETSAVHSNLGAALRTKKDLEEAIAEYKKAIELNPRSVAAHYNLGNALRDRKDVDGAIAEYKKAIELNANFVFAHYMLGVALEDKKDMDGAVAAFRKAIELDPKDATAHVNLGNSLYAKQNVDGAIAAYKKAIELDPNSVAAHSSLGNALRTKKDVVGAIAAYRKAIELDPNSANAYNGFGAALDDKKDVDSAIAAYRKAIELDPKLAAAYNNLGNALHDKKDLDGAIAAYKQAIAIDRKLAPVHYNLGVALRDKKDLDGAITEFNKAIALDTKFTFAHTNIGSALRDKGDVDGAIAAHKKAIELDPNYAIAHNNLGIALHAKKDLDGAIAAYRTAIALDPNYALAHTNLGTALRDKGDVDGAIAAHKKAIELDPNYAIAHNNLGIALRAKKDLDGAIAAYRTAIALDPNYALAHTNLGNTLYAKQNVDGAIAEYKKAIALDPEDAQTHYNLGHALHAKKDLDGAIAEFRKAIEFDPKYVAAYIGIGVVLRAKKDLDGAVAAYKQAIEIDPKDAIAHNNLGIALEAKKDLDGAIAEYKKVIAIDPKDAQAHGELGMLLLRQGRFDEARTEIRRYLELLPDRDPSSQFVSRQLQRCVQMAAVDEKLQDVLKGEAEPTTAEQLSLGQLCQHYKQRYTAAFRFYADAFAAAPKLAENLDDEDRYNAACCATLAAAGQGIDAKNLPDKVQLMLRRQALTWLRADLAVYEKRAERAEPAAKQFVRQRLGHWKEDSDLASVRDDQGALDNLPEDERKQWRKLWADVDYLLRQLKEVGAPDGR